MERSVLNGFGQIFRLYRDPVVKNLIRLFCIACARTVGWSKNADVLHRLAVAHAHVYHRLHQEMEIASPVSSGLQAWLRRAALKVGELVAQLRHFRLK